MTKPLDSFFNLPPIDSEKQTVIESLPIADSVEDTNDVEITSTISTSDKVDYALPVVTGLDMHDMEMDDIARKAVDTFDDLIALGGNVPDMHAGKIYEVAGQMLKTALDAKNAKAEKKLKMIELQLKKIRAEQVDFELGTGNIKNTGTGEFDRNELIKHLVSIKSEKTDK